MKPPEKYKGFSLLELMVVVAIIAILALMAMPSYDSRIIRTQIVESVDLVKQLKGNVNAFYILNKQFPDDNQDAGLPKADFLLGNYVERVEVKEGAFHIFFGNKAQLKLKDKILSIRPLIVKGSPDSPISWVCGNASIPNGMEAVGENLTTVAAGYLPVNCF